LSIFNPLKPEGSWELDLSRREERLLVKIFCVLGVHEPGNNFSHAEFRWSRETENMPGWELVRHIFCYWMFFRMISFSV
jgi:hypothetical protein